MEEDDEEGAILRIASEEGAIVEEAGTTRLQLNVAGTIDFVEEAATLGTDMRQERPLQLFSTCSESEGTTERAILRQARSGSKDGDEGATERQEQRKERASCRN